MSEPLDHIYRAVLPWRAQEMTECGRLVNDVGGVISVEEVTRRWKEWGKQRTAFTVCMTCLNTANYQDRWESDPAGVMRRWCSLDASNHERMNTELRAIAALIDAHRTQFDGFVAGVAATTNLAERRHNKAKGSTGAGQTSR